MMEKRASTFASPGSFAQPLQGDESSSNKSRVPAAAAQFPGSFAPDLRKDGRKPHDSRNWRDIVIAYFGYGWWDISIWKSAVSLPPPLESSSKQKFKS